jgi:hypothetical protein
VSSAGPTIWSRCSLAHRHAHSGTVPGLDSLGSNPRWECLPSSWPCSVLGPRHQLRTDRGGHERSRQVRRNPGRRACTPWTSASAQGEGGFELLRLGYCLREEVRDRRHWNTDDGAEHQERHVAPAPEQLAGVGGSRRAACGASFLTNGRFCNRPRSPAVNPDSASTTRVHNQRRTTSPVTGFCDDPEHGSSARLRSRIHY